MKQVQKHQTVGESTYEAIRNDIIFGRLVPETKLKLSQMKNSYDASISTLREILNRLASEGFVIAAEQRGFFVAPVSASDLREISDLRCLLECNALRQSIENGDNDWEGNVAAAHHKLHRMEQKMHNGDHDETEIWKQYDAEFHQALISACGSNNLMEIHKTIYDKYLRYQMQILTFRGEIAADEHKDMFEAAMDRDVEKAESLLLEHIRGGLDHTLSRYSNLVKE